VIVSENMVNGAGASRSPAKNGLNSGFSPFCKVLLGVVSLKFDSVLVHLPGAI